MTAGFGDSSSGRPDPPRIDIPDHELLCLIGQGSYGQVWMARNTIGTYRAVKIIQKSTFQHERPFEREIEGIQKFEPISRTHPGLVAILHVGRSQDGNYFYYVMELGDDINTGTSFDPEKYQVKSLASTVWDRGCLPVDRCIDLALSLSDALAYLHSNELIHRDVKPANIIFVAGYPKLADIGLVAEAKSASTYVGTEGFIPPEGPNSVQGDVFSLGKTLYEIATGQDRNQFPTLPSSVVEESQDPRFMELVEIINQACHHDTGARYATARAMHAEITALANGQSIRRLRLLERRMLTFSRLAKVAAVVLIPFLVLLFGVKREWERRIQDTHREIGIYEAKAAADLEDGDYSVALRNVEQALARSPHDPTNREIQHLRASAILDRIPTLTHFWVSDASVNAVCFGKGASDLYVAGDRGVVARYSLNDNLSLRFKGHVGDVRGLDYHEEAGLVLSCGVGDFVRLWNAGSGAEVRKFSHRGSLWAVAFSSDAKFFVSGGDTQPSGVAEIRYWDIGKTDEPLRKLSVPEGVKSLAFNEDGTKVAIGMGSSLLIWDLTSAGEPRVLEHRDIVYDVSFVDRDSRVISASDDGVYRIWNLGTGFTEYASQPQNFAVRAFDQSRDGRYIVTAGWDSVARIWTRSGGRLMHPVLKHSGRVNTVRFNDAGNRIATGSSDGSIRVWDLAGMQAPTRHDGKWTANHRGLFAQLADEKVKVWRGGTVRPHKGLSSKGMKNPRLLQTDGERHLALVGDVSESVSLLRIGKFSDEQAKVSEIDVEFADPIEHVAVAPSHSLVAVSGGSRFGVFDSVSGESYRPQQKLKTSIRRLFFSNSGEQLFIQSAWEVLVIDCDTFQNVIPPIRSGHQFVYSVVDPSDQLLAVAESDLGLEERHTLVYRFRESNTPISRFKHRDGVLAAAFSPEALEIVTASEDATAVFWDLNSGESTERTLQHKNGVTDVAYSQNGQFVVTSTTDRKVQLWDADTAFPVTPPIFFPWDMEFGAFDHDSNQLVCQSVGRGVTWTWRIRGRITMGPVFLGYINMLCGDQLKRNAAGKVDLRAWNAIRESMPELLLVTDEERTQWHQEQAFDALVSLLKLPKGIDDEEFERLKRAERFHANMAVEISGRDDPAYEAFKRGIYQRANILEGEGSSERTQ